MCHQDRNTTHFTHPPLNILPQRPRKYATTNQRGRKIKCISYRYGSSGSLLPLPAPPVLPAVRDPMFPTRYVLCLGPASRRPSSCTIAILSTSFSPTPLSKPPIHFNPLGVDKSGTRLEEWFAFTHNPLADGLELICGHKWSFGDPTSAKIPHRMGNTRTEPSHVRM